MAHTAPWRVSSCLPIIEGESVDGYVARVAAAHYFPRMAEITQIGGAEVNDRAHASFCDAEGVEAIADCLRVEPNLLRHHAPILSRDGKMRNMFGLDLPKDHFQFTYRRFSPTALKASPHHRALWSLRVFPFCTETWEYLVDRCSHPACNRQQRWRRTLGIDLCDFCGEPLSRAKAGVVPVHLRENLQCLVDLVHPDAHRRRKARRLLPPELAEMETGDLLTLACILAPVIDYRAGRPLTLWSLSLSKAADVIVPALAGTWPLLRNWPNSFEELLAYRINQHAKARGDGNHGASYRFLSRFRDRDLPPAVRNLIDEFTDHCRGAHERGLTGQEAANIVGSQVSTLVTMRRAGRTPSVLSLTGQRLHVLFDKGAIGELAEKLQPRERLVQAAWQLGIPTYSLRELVYRGPLTTAPAPPGRSTELTVHTSSLAAFVEGLEAQMEEANDDHPVRLTKLMLRIGGGPKPWASVLKAIHDGQLHAALRSGAGPLAGRIYFRDDEVLSASAFTDLAVMDWQGVKISKADMADILGLSRTNFSRYCEFLLGPGGTFREIFMEDAIRVAQSIISTTELAQRLQLHHTAAHRLASQRNVVVRSAGLFDRVSAEELIPELFDECPQIKKFIRSDRAYRKPGDPIKMRAMLTKDWRVRLPAHLCQRLGVEAESEVELEETKGGILIRTS